MRRSIVSFFVLVAFLSSANELDIDSLKKILKRTNIHDTTRLRALCILAEKAPDGEWDLFNQQMYDLAEKKFSTSPPEFKEKYDLFFGYACNNKAYILEVQGEADRAKAMYRKALSVFQKYPRARGNIASIYNNMGSMFQSIGQKDSAIECFKASIKLAEELDIKSVAGHAYNNLGLVYYRMGNIPLALEYLYKNIRVQEQIGDEDGLGASCNNLGQIMAKNGDTIKALEFYNKALAIREKQQFKEHLAIVLNNIGSIKCAQGEVDEALRLFHRSLRLKKDISDFQAMANSYMNIAKLHSYVKNYDSAEIYSYKAVDVLEKMQSKKGLSGAYAQLGSIFIIRKNWKGAEAYTLRALGLSKEFGLAEEIKTCANQLFIIYKNTKRFDRSLEMHELYMQMSDSLNNQGTKKAIMKNQLSYDYEKKAFADSVKVAEEKRIGEIKLGQERTQKYYLYVGLGLVLIFAFFMLNRFKVTSRQKKIIERQKHIVEEKNKEITDSINYAQKIQRTLLASQTMLNNNLQNYFVFFNPKDIVSGDFYWASNAHGKFYLAVADSTGHGVPGAFMSLLNISFLNEAINEKNLKNTNDILDHTRQRLIQSLTSDTNEGGGNDGMDCSLLCFDFKKMTLEFTCANNPILIIRNNELIEHTPDKMPVGKSPKLDQSFSKQEFQLQKDDIVYAFTDGYSDQFGGPKGKKFKYKHLCQLLLSSSPNELKLQQDLLQKEFGVWKGKLEQVDDVLVFGIKV